MGQWPPTWGAFYDRYDKLAYDEEPEKLNAVEASDDENTITLTSEYKGNDCIAVITILDPGTRLKLMKYFHENIGKSIKEIGSLDINIP